MSKTMYKIKPLSVVPNLIELPKSMYNIKPLSRMDLDSLSDSLPGTKRVKMDPQYQAIEDHQLRVIARLKELRNTVDNLIRNAGGQNQGQGQQLKDGQQAKSTPVGKISSSSSGAALSNVALPSELVVEANPARPPFSLLFFKKLNPSIRILTHTHSSCDKRGNQKLETFCKDTPDYSATIRIVWKHLAGSRLTPPNLGSSAVEGESNVARYLSRLLSPSDSVMNYDAIPLDDLVLVDNVLASSDLVDESPDSFLSSLQAYVQQRKNGTRTIADLVGYSTLRYLTEQQPNKSLQKSIVDWMNSCTNEGLC